jgi:hypothetical protein
MPGEISERKNPGRVAISSEEKLLVGRLEAAELLSISARALDYLVANKQLATRRIEIDGPTARFFEGTYGALSTAIAMFPPCRAWSKADDCD